MSCNCLSWGIDHGYRWKERASSDLTTRKSTVLVNPPSPAKSTMMKKVDSTTSLASHSMRPMRDRIDSFFEDHNPPCDCCPSVCPDFCGFKEPSPLLTYAYPVPADKVSQVSWKCIFSLCTACYQYNLLNTERVRGMSITAPDSMDMT